MIFYDGKSCFFGDIYEPVCISFDSRQLINVILKGYMVQGKPFAGRLESPEAWKL